jgi:short-subunit dehydrogenase
MPRAVQEQVVVITGASSGIGRVTARRFAEKGARVVLGARNGKALKTLVEEIAQSGGQAVAAPTDVSRREQMEQLAQTAVSRFGRVDTWVNNAGVSIYSMFDKLTDEEIRRIMDVNFMGVVYGVQAAVPIMRQHGGGVIINIASVAGKRALPLQSIYSASKHAIVALGEALRAELAQAGPEIHVCTICPPSINTMFFDHAATKEGYAPRPLPPVYDPETVANDILACAVQPRREIVVGAAGKCMALFDVVAPGFLDWLFGQIGVGGQLTDEPKSADAPSNVFAASPHPQERGPWSRLSGRRDTPSVDEGRVLPRSPLGAVLSMAALVLLSRSWFKAA